MAAGGDPAWLLILHHLSQLQVLLDKLEATAYRASLRSSGLTEEASEFNNHRTAIVSTPSCWSRVALQPACFLGPQDKERNRTVPMETSTATAAVQIPVSCRQFMSLKVQGYTQIC